MVAEDSAIEAIADRYRRFAEKEAAGQSALYEAAALLVAKDKSILTNLAGLPQGKQQPNLLFAGLRHRFGLTPDAERFLAPARDAWPELVPILEGHSTQTNEPGRCAGLLPLLARLPQPLALLEVGASAGLCLLPDRYGYDYRADGHQQRLLPSDGGPDTPIFPCDLRGTAPLPTTLPQVIWRAGLDLNPLDLKDPETAEWLQTLVWPEQKGRAARLRQAMAIARRNPPAIRAGDLNEALAALAGEAPKEASLVIFHSAVLAYLPPEARQAFAAKVGALDAVWISNEAESVLPAEGLTPDPDGLFFVIQQDGLQIARADPHGRALRWLE